MPDSVAVLALSETDDEQALVSAEADGGPACVCCGLHFCDEPAACGHFFCYVCVGRGHDEDCLVCNP